MTPNLKGIFRKPLTQFIIGALPLTIISIRIVIAYILNH